jgi:hypothetical protein
MRSYLTSHLAIALHAVIIAIVFMGASWYASRAVEDLEHTLLGQIDLHVKELQKLAVLTDQNGADAVTERVIRDCPRRPEFESLLNTLSTASKKQLIDVQQLFESCGAFFAERKALMVVGLEREYAALENALVLLKELRELSPQEQTLGKWADLIELEQTKSDNLTEQTTIQAEIISVLIEKDRFDPRIAELMRRAQAINESLNTTDKMIDAVRLTLTS